MSIDACQLMVHFTHIPTHNSHTHTNCLFAGGQKLPSRFPEQHYDGAPVRGPLHRAEWGEGACDYPGADARHAAELRAQKGGGGGWCNWGRKKARSAPEPPMYYSQPYPQHMTQLQPGVITQVYP